MPTTNFAVAINNIATTVAASYTAGSGKLYVASTTGITVAEGKWVRVSTFRSGSPLSILKATAVGSDGGGAYLTISGGVDGYSDVNLLVGDAAELRVTAGAFNDLATAVNTLEAVPPNSGVAIGDSVSGGTNSCILYVDGNGNLADSGPYWDGTRLAVPGGPSLYHWEYENASWIDMATTGPSGIGTGGPGFNAWIAFCNSYGGQWFRDSQQYDICYRNLQARMLFGFTNNGNSSIQFSPEGANFSIPIGLTSQADDVASNNQLYFSTTTNKLTYKDPSGILHAV